jgi:hypothetical protein
MASTNFVDQVTVVEADWLNDVNDVVYEHVVNVKLYGAVGDGVTDDSTAIQAAIDYAESIVNTSAYGGTGVGVWFPSGDYLCNTGLSITSSGVGLYGQSSRGSRIFTDGGIDLLTIGDPTDTTSTFEIHLENLFFDCEDLENTDTVGLRIYRTFLSSVRNCIFRGFYECVVGERANRWVFTKVTTNQNRATAVAKASFRFKGLASGSGGGLHITDCELAGGGALVPSVTAHILVEECDGLYVVNTHTRDCGHAVLVSPDATTGKSIIDSLFFHNCYFDENSTYNVRLTGTIGASSRYQFIHFNNCYFRGTNLSTNCVRIDITSSGFTGQVKSIQFNGGAMRQATSTAVIALGAASGFTEVYGLSIKGVYFESCNFGAGATISGINAEVESLSISGCMFNEDATATARVINVEVSSLNSNKCSFIILGNDFSKSNCTNIDPILLSNTVSGISSVVADNIYPSLSRKRDQVHTLVTTNATPAAIWTFVVPEGVAGFVEVEVSGTTSDGATSVVYTFNTGFRRDSVSTTLSTGTNNFTAGVAWNPDAIASPPTCTLSTNTLTATVTGVAATTIYWSANVKLNTAR